MAKKAANPTKVVSAKSESADAPSLPSAKASAKPKKPAAKEPPSKAGAAGAPVKAQSADGQAKPVAAKAHLTITSKNYSSWSLRGWLICRLSGLDFVEDVLPADDPTTRAELLLMAPSFRVPRLRHERVDVWDTLAIADYLHEIRPQAGIYPKDVATRAHCRAVCGEMHSGFANLRAALPMNVKGRYPGFKVWAGAQQDIDRIATIWRECLAQYGGPYLFGAQKSVADAMFAPVCLRFVTYDVALDPVCAAYRDHVVALPPVKEWIDAAQEEPDELEELDVEF
jgi:glutathione S-transferase